MAEIYYYDADGLRIRTKHYDKSSRSYVLIGETTYEYSGDTLVYQVRKSTTGAVEKELYFFYDSYGKLSYIKYYKNNGAQNGNYFVTTNLQGDVLGLYNSSGSLAVSYEYDAWGNVISVKGSSGAELSLEAHPDHIGIVNPIRYRGYYYDSETGLYYLQSRYYDAEIGRFINADGTLNGNGDVLGFNMFAYCGNNPVMYSDPSGCGIFDRIAACFTYVGQEIKKKFIQVFYKDEILPYSSVEEAATDSGRTLNNLTQNNNLEYGQGIVYNDKTDTYGLTDIVTGEHSSVNFAPILTNNTGNELVALVHSHPNCNGHIPNEFSNTIINGDSVSGDWVVSSTWSINLYLAAPNGCLYLMEWDAGEYNQSEVNSNLPVDNSIFECVQ